MKSLVITNIQAYEEITLSQEHVQLAEFDR